jgi:hypothetical protein
VTERPIGSGSESHRIEPAVVISFTPITTQHSPARSVNLIRHRTGVRWQSYAEETNEKRRS